MATIKPMSNELMKNEIQYLYIHSHQISGQTGLTAMMNTHLGSTPVNFEAELYPYQYTMPGKELLSGLDAEAKDIASALGKIDFKNDAALEIHPFMRGWRIENEKYIFLVAYSTQTHYLKGNLYLRVWFEDHMERASKGIRFITPDYTPLFRIPDGATIVETKGGYEVCRYECRYIDDYHLFVGNSCYHICELAERYASAGIKVDSDQKI